MADNPGAEAIVAKNASKMFLDGAVVAFRQLDLRVRDKEILCIVGPSGCGKTTFLRCIAGLTDLTGGELLVGAPETRRRSLKLGIAIHASDTAAAVAGGLRGQLPPKVAVSLTAVSTVNTALAILGSLPPRRRGWPG